MSLTLIITLIKLVVYPVVIAIVFKIGRITGYWKGWLFVTLGMLMPFLTVILQIVDLLTSDTDYSAVTVIIPLLSNICLGFGFYFIYLEVKTGNGHKSFNIRDWLHKLIS